MLDGLHLGRYRLLKRIATGGMAEIYLAELEADTGLSRNVVIKTILPQFTQDAAMRTMLQDEARIGFSLHHRNIVQVVDVGDEQDLLYIAMEYVEGANLAQLSELASPGDDAEIWQDIGLVAHIGLEVLAALDYAHNRTEDGRSLEIVHRDVSPQNILISTAGEVKLSDFGIALAKDRITKTTIGGVKGKLAYIPPEQATANAIGPSADVFSTAAVLYELLTGNGPYEATTDIGILKAIERGLIGSIAIARPDLPPELASAIDRALSQSPGARPTAGDLRGQLEPFAMPASQAEKALKERARAVRGSLTQQSKHQRQFENAIMGKADGSAAMNVRPTTATGGSEPVSRDHRGASLLLYGVVAISAAFAAFLIWPENTEQRSAAVSPTPPDAATDFPFEKTDRDEVGGSLVPPPGQSDAAPLPLEKPAVERAKRGTLSITSFPWAEVEVDGKKVGNTPVRHLRLRAGKHKVVLRNPQSGKRVQRSVTIKPGKNVTLRIKPRAQ